MKKSFLYSILILVVFLSGCAGALLGNNERPHQSENKQQRSIERIKADGMITSDVKSRYANDVILRKLNVKTYKGVVTLLGSVPTQNVMARAIRLAQSVKGVRKVHSGLRLR